MNNYFLFLDESGHHGLKTVNQEFPIFLLCGCLIDQKYFRSEFTKNFNNLKLKYFGNRDIIFHSRDIRKWQGSFKVLGDIKLRSKFYEDLDSFISNSNFKIIASAILKNELIKSYGPRSSDPYDLSLTFILERTVFLTDTFHCNKVEVVAEARGRKEDSNLHNQHQIILSNGTSFVSNERFKKRITDITFVNKSENNLGTQLCDLVAYPLATKIIYPDRENLAFRVIEPKIYKQFPDGDYLGYGLKIFP